MSWQLLPLSLFSFFVARKQWNKKHDQKYVASVVNPKTDQLLLIQESCHEVKVPKAPKVVSSLDRHLTFTLYIKHLLSLFSVRHEPTSLIICFGFFYSRFLFWLTMIMTLIDLWDDSTLDSCSQKVSRETERDGFRIQSKKLGIKIVIKVRQRFCKHPVIILVSVQCP